ncbi:unnamed protein product [Strongylus vulgaris]|uniref:7TM GPCR serpentine receptor class x (Srx) domain-containing protein n=1 Tax=Strongylus vulgaris TaxID=40348 RepID=A0A3P7IQJ8_STRVU|nr:unnamed protein product [Strongylus vulgaris]
MFDPTMQNRNEDLVAGLIMVTAAGLGCIINITVMTMIVKTPFFHNAYGYICFSHLIADTAILLTNVFWGGPVTFLILDDSITNTFIGARIGQLVNFFWFEAFYCHLQVAINRLIAVAWPFAYKLVSQSICVLTLL